MTITTDVGEFNILNIKIIDSETKTIYIEEKAKGFVILITNKLLDVKSNVKLLQGFKVIRDNNDKYIELLGFDLKLKISQFTKLNIGTKKLMFIEEISDGNYRLTFSSSFINDISNLEKLEINDV